MTQLTSSNRRATTGVALAALTLAMAAPPAMTQAAPAVSPAAVPAAPSVGEPTPPPVPKGAKRAAVAVIKGSGGLTVQVGQSFPQVVSYTLGTAKLWGQTAELNTFRIDGTDHVATTKLLSSAGAAATYSSTFASLPGVTIASRLTVNPNNTVTFKITKVTSTAAINQISIPNHNLIATTSADAGAQLARTKVATDSTTTADQFVALAAGTPIDAAPVGTPYGFVSNGLLAGGIITNATDDANQDSNTNWNSRLQSQITEPTAGTKIAALSVGNWTYQPRGATDPRVATFELPEATVVVAPDRNNSKTVDWQDGAIAFRDAMTTPQGADRVADRVIQHIPFNFASQATNPFLKTLDNVKRISMNTDDLGQWILEKGYTSEGHDSGHPDFGGDINTRAGGVEDFNTLIDEGAKYNTDVAVHVNATEAYAQAKSFDARMVQGQVNGWNWLNQAYHIDQRYDLGSGKVIDRFAQLRKDAPNLSGVYIDAYYSSGWLSDGLVDQLEKMNLEVATEWAYKFEGSSIWSHWANDKNYGGATNKGINSNIIRFIANGDRDVWNVDPLLGGADIKEFEGWTGQTDYNRFYDNIWVANLPTKFLQHFDVMSWDFGKSATLTDGVSVSATGGVRTISMSGTPVAVGDTYLLPWQSATGNEATSPLNADKMYYYSGSGGAQTFTLTSRFAGTSAFTLYKLTDQGRVKAADVTATGGKVTITGDKATPYVLVPAGAAAGKAANYGAGSGLVDPGFNAGSVTAWAPTGAVGTVRNSVGDNVAQFGAGTGSLQQKVNGLTPGGRYTFSADVEIAAGFQRPVTLSAGAASRTFDGTPQQNMMASDTKKGTYSQRASVQFVAGADGAATVKISVGDGTAVVKVDDARVMADTSAASPIDPTVLVSNDFEGNQPGWGPFIKGDAGGATDPRTSISIRHDPYSQQSWKNTYSPFNSGALAGKAVDDVLTGNASLKAHEENGGLVYRTVPASVPFQAGHAYEVSFDYQSSLAGEWAWITGADSYNGADGIASTDRITTAMGQALSTTRFTDTIVAGCGQTWVGLRRTGGSGGADFVLDNFTVKDLGVSTTPAACATQTAPASLTLNPGSQTEFTTSFTNNEKATVTQVHQGLSVPAGWTVQVAKEGGNLVGSLASGATMTTTWLITAPAGSAPAQLTVTGSYVDACVAKEVTATTPTTTSTRTTFAPSSMTATTDSQNPGPDEGPVAYVLDNNLGTIWHTDYTNATDPYPHWVALDLKSVKPVNGFGFQGRQSGGPNGRVKDYTVEVSSDGATWTQVAKGSLVDVPTMQEINFASVDARYVRFNALNALNGQPFAAAAEMRVFGEPGAPIPAFDPAPKPAPNC